MHPPLALIAAGGEGKRLGADGPKALVLCAGRPLLSWCLDAFVGSAAFGGGGGRVVVAAHAADMPAFKAAVEEARAGGLSVQITEGGPSRSHSVAAALSAAGEVDDDAVVLVHDAARIFTTPGLVDALVDGLRSEADLAGLIAAAPAVDTIKRVDVGSTRIVETPPRDQLWAVQTPQGFRAAALRRALSQPDEKLAAASDDASLVEDLGERVDVFDWRQPNPKITTAADLSAAEAQLS